MFSTFPLYCICVISVFFLLLNVETITSFPVSDWVALYETFIAKALLLKEKAETPVITEVLTEAVETFCSCVWGRASFTFVVVISDRAGLCGETERWNISATLNVLNCKHVAERAHNTASLILQGHIIYNECHLKHRNAASKTPAPASITSITSD